MASEPKDPKRLEFRTVPRRDADIAALEAELRVAQLTADVAALDRLISDDLLFTGPDGTLGTKADDLKAYREGVMRVATHEPEKLHVRHVGAHVALVALRARMTGSYAGTPFAGIASYSRVWAREDGRWRIVGGHVSVVPMDMDAAAGGRAPED
jgi:ketosteroid isomerase-like protein